MRNLLIAAFTTALIFLGITSSVRAATVSPTPFLSLSIPGTCGDASSTDPKAIKCCKTAVSSPDLITAQFRSNVPAFGQFLADILADKINEKAAIILFTQREIKSQACIVGSPSTPGDTNNDSCICIVEPTKEPLSAMAPICDRISSTTGEQGSCKSCAQGGGLWTSLGCFSGNLSEFIGQKILKTGVGIAGGISLLCIMFAAFQMQTSSGNAEKIKKAQELLTNCITGLMIIIFSILILKIIGVDILRLPNFGV